MSLTWETDLILLIRCCIEESPHDLKQALVIVKHRTSVYASKV
jgi:hypothetical protein